MLGRRTPGVIEALGGHRDRLLAARQVYWLVVVYVHVFGCIGRPVDGGQTLITAAAAHYVRVSIHWRLGDGRHRWHVMIHLTRRHGRVVVVM